MSEQKIRLLSDLMTISQIKPGQTLVVDTMTVITHSWSTSVWRSINGGRENRWRTVAHIRDIISDALNELKVQFDPELYNYLDLALKGVANLKETYSGEYYLCSDVTKLICESREAMAELAKQKETKQEDETVVEIPKELEEEVKAQLEDLDQKIHPNTVGEGEGRCENKSIIEAMVSASDRTGSEETAQREVADDSSGSNRENNIRMSSVDCVCGSVEQISQDTTQIVLSASDSVLKKKANESPTRAIRRRRIWSKRSK